MKKLILLCSFFLLFSGACVDEVEIINPSNDNITNFNTNISGRHKVGTDISILLSISNIPPKQQWQYIIYFNNSPLTNGDLPVNTKEWQFNIDNTFTVPQNFFANSEVIPVGTYPIRVLLKNARDDGNNGEREITITVEN